MFCVASVLLTTFDNVNFTYEGIDPNKRVLLITGIAADPIDLGDLPEQYRDAGYCVDVITPFRMDGYRLSDYTEVVSFSMGGFVIEELVRNELETVMNSSIKITLMNPVTDPFGSLVAGDKGADSTKPWFLHAFRFLLRLARFGDFSAVREVAAYRPDTVTIIYSEFDEFSKHPEDWVGVEYRCIPNAKHTGLPVFKGFGEIVLG